MEKINEAVGMKNHVDVGRGRKRIVCPFKSQELCKCVGCILSVVNYRKKGQKVCSEITKQYGKMEPTKLKRDVCGNTNLYEVFCYLYCTFYIHA